MYSILGTAPGSQNVIQFIDVGVVNELVVTDLSLTPGMIYYAAIKGAPKLIELLKHYPMI